MSRHLLLALVAAGLCVGCASRPAAESDVLVSRIYRPTSANLVCNAGDVRMCTIDEEDVKHCQCVDHSEIFGRR